MRIKVSVGSESKIISIPTEAEQTATLLDLINHYIDAETFSHKIPKDKYRSVRFGYPIRSISVYDLNNNDGDNEVSTQSLQDLGIKNGDKITIETELDGNPIITESKKKAKDRKLLKNEIVHKNLLLEDIPDDNSCLFHSFSYCLFKPTNSEERMSYSNKLRKICSDHILKNPVEFNQAVLEKPVKEYSRWILDRNVWGGGIEISILSNYFKIAIYVLDLKFKSFEKFNEDKFNDFIILFYNGTHYDVCKMKDNEKSVFNKSSDYETQILLTNVLELSDVLKKEGYLQT